MSLNLNFYLFSIMWRAGSEGSGDINLPMSSPKRPHTFAEMQKQDSFTCATSSSFWKNLFYKCNDPGSSTMSLQWTVIVHACVCVCVCAPVLILFHLNMEKSPIFVNLCFGISSLLFLRHQTPLPGDGTHYSCSLGHQLSRKLDEEDSLPGQSLNRTQ
jgi:hypothetical protein